MSTKIRLSRSGAKKRPFYRIVIADTRSPRDGRFIERVGTYNPMVPKDHPERIVLKEERIKHWLKNGALPTDRVARFLGDANIIEKRVPPEQTKKHLPKEKTLERIKEKQEAQKENLEEKAETPEKNLAEEASAEETPAKEVPAEEASAEEAPAKEVPAEEASAEETPAKEVPAEESNVNEVDKKK